MFKLISPQEKLDFSLDFTTWLDAGVSVAGTPTWSISPTGPTIGDQQDANDISTIFVSLATLGVVYELSCLAVTDATPAQTIERTITIRCEDNR